MGPATITFLRGHLTGVAAFILAWALSLIHI